MGQDNPEFHVTTTQNMTAALVGALVTAVTMTPLDVVKTRIQAQQRTSTKLNFYYNGLMDHMHPCINKEGVWYCRTYKFKGTLDGIMKITRYEGVFSLWAGLSPTLVLALPATVFYFVSYEELKLKLNNRFSRDHVQPLWVPFAAACSARFLSTVIVSPLELIRTKMQAKNMNYLEVHMVLKSIFYFQGFKGFWRGVNATLFRDVLFSGIYWFGYETIRVRYPEFPILGSFLAGTAAGAISSIITTPFDVVKTHQQIMLAEEIITESPIKYKKGMFPVFQQIYTEHGFKGFFAGIVPRTLRVAPGCAIMITTFEYGKIVFSSL